jgi:hypothetical protein
MLKAHQRTQVFRSSSSTSSDQPLRRIPAEPRKGKQPHRETTLWPKHLPDSSASCVLPGGAFRTSPNRLPEKTIKTSTRQYTAGLDFADSTYPQSNSKSSKFMIGCSVLGPASTQGMCMHMHGDLLPLKTKVERHVLFAFRHLPAADREEAASPLRSYRRVARWSEDTRHPGSRRFRAGRKVRSKSCLGRR